MSNVGFCRSVGNKHLARNLTCAASLKKQVKCFLFARSEPFRFCEFSNSISSKLFNGWFVCCSFAEFMPHHTCKRLDVQAYRYADNERYYACNRKAALRKRRVGKSVSYNFLRYAARYAAEKNRKHGLAAHFVWR